nr:MAG TPA: hypothetical protein [Caudoviricetes sp.]
MRWHRGMCLVSFFFFCPLCDPCLFCLVCKRIHSQV